MKPPEEVRRELVRQWIEKADQDLAAAVILLENAVLLKPVIAFHAQQAVEKYLKALLVRHQVNLPKTHDIGAVLSLVAVCEPAAALALQQTTVLTPFGVEVRYPGDTPELLHGEDLRAVEIARHARHVVKELLKTYLTPDN